jgi:DNA-binding CsgD family transcriptional regulator
MSLQLLATDAAPFPPHAEAVLALAGMVGAIGDAGFGQVVIAQLNRLLPLCWWNVYRLLDDAPPQLRIAGCLGADDCIATAFGDYRAGLYRQDRVLALLREQAAAGRSAMGHAHARELSAEHRRRIYSRHGLRERLSLAQPDGAAGLLMINLYRHERQPAFSDTERDTLQQIGPLLLACAARHLALAPQAAADPGEAGALAGLTRREREVCDRLLRGWTHDGIAADLQLSATTVKTYRDRAFARLGIHHRNALFALALADLRARPPAPG